MRHASLGFVFRFVVGFTGLKIEHPTRQFERLNEPQVFDLILRFFFYLYFPKSIYLYIVNCQIIVQELELKKWCDSLLPKRKKKESLMIMLQAFIISKKCVAVIN